MAKSKTGSFWLTETVLLTDSTAQQGTIDLGAYVDVGDQQAIAVEQVECIVQGRDTAGAGEKYMSAPALIWSAPGAVQMQLTDLSRGLAIIQANDSALVSSGAYIFDDGNNVTSMANDVYPDTYGKLDEARMVVNDQLYCTAITSGTLIASRHVYVTFRIKCRIVKLDKRDWMAIAIQSVSADN